MGDSTSCLGAMGLTGHSFELRLQQHSADSRTWAENNKNNTIKASVSLLLLCWPLRHSSLLSRYSTGCVAAVAMTSEQAYHKQQTSLLSYVASNLILWLISSRLGSPPFTSDYLAHALSC